MNWRSPKLRETARGRACLMYGPTCNNDPATTVWAHSNRQRHGKGMGIKSHDVFGAWLCSACHDWYDGRTRTGKIEHDALDVREAAFEAAHDRTLLILVCEGRLKVA